VREDAQGKHKGHNRERAIALQYQDLHELPQVTASGVGQFARDIIALAKQHHVPVEQNSELAERLSGLRIGEAVTPEGFKLLAALLSYLYHVDREWREKHPFLDKVMEGALVPEPVDAADPLGRALPNPSLVTTLTAVAGVKRLSPEEE
jgi:flagellar biosynthesis protein